MPKETENKSRLTPKQSAFLRAYATVGTILQASKAAGIARSRHYEWRGQPEYDAAFNEASEEFTEYLESVAIESATIGLQEPIVYQGQVMYEPQRNKDGSLKMKNGVVLYTDKPVTIRKQNPVERIFLLKAKRPDVYRDNAKVEHTGPGGAPLEVTVKFVESKTA